MKQEQDTTRVLLVGLNGVNNTGAEARVLAIIDDVRAVLGPATTITIPSSTSPPPGATSAKTPTCTSSHPSVYFAALRRLVREHGLVLLCEGSVYMDTWTPSSSTTFSGPRTALTPLASPAWPMRWTWARLRP